jgi:DNA ligase-associated metallophosphoesterase
MRIDWEGQQLQLLSSKAIYWEEESILFLADLHLGKAAHFRKEGLAVPTQVLHSNLGKFEALIKIQCPKRVLFLGDLFHSELNYAWEYFIRMLSKYQDISFELVMGNHDILGARNYINSGLKLHETILEMGPFVFSHFPIDDLPDYLYNFHGHIHPGVQLVGPGKQYMKLPCFHFGSRHCVLPAYGAFTGLASIVPKKGDRVFVITGDRVSEVS